MIEKVCKWCNETIIVEKHILFASHVSSCKSNPNFLKRIEKCKNDFTGKEIVERLTIEKECPRCNNVFKLTGTKKQLYGRDSKKYCSDKCARARPQSKETKEKIANSLMNNGNWYDFNKNKIPKEKIVKEEVIKEKIVWVKKERIRKKYSYSFICILCNKEGSSTSKKTTRHADCYKKVSGGYKKGSGLVEFQEIAIELKK